MAALVLVFITIAIDRIWELRMAAERAGVEHTIGTLKSALGLEVVTRIMRGGLERLADLDGSNPIELLKQPPDNYIGELDTPDPTRLEGYSWYFDREQKLLIYRVANGEILQSPLSGPARIRFAVRFDYRDRNGDGAFSPQEDTVRGINLVPAEEFRWKER